VGRVTDFSVAAWLSRFIRGAALRLALAAVLLASSPRMAAAFGDIGAFDPRVLLTGAQTAPARPTAPGRWAVELLERTAAPARLHPSAVRADDAAIVDEPFLYWSSDVEVAPLTGAEVSGLRRFFALGGILLVDDAAPGMAGDPGAFGRSARREIARVLPDAEPIAIGPDHVVFRTFYLLDRAEGRVEGHPSLDAIVRAGRLQVIFSDHDLGGALARNPAGMWQESAVPGGERQREHAIRLAVNIAMYSLCSNYKDDQVHAPFLMQRRAMGVTR
jgi:hypothetical protein